MPEPPAFLLDEAKAVWQGLAPKMVKIGTLSRLDIMPFAAFCDACGLTERAERAFAESGSELTIKRPRGGIVINPLLKIAATARADAVKFGAEFGLSP